MKKDNINITILVFFHLLVFTFPFTVKHLHHHKTQNIYHQVTGQKLLSQAEIPCPVCKFEFVSFISKHIRQYCVYLPISQLKSFGFIQKGYKVIFTTSLLRAPPLS
jgi:hypothetical protein